MGYFELFILSVGLAMDAFAVSVCKGLSIGKIKKCHMFKAGAWFGGFQGLMPLIGFYFSILFVDLISEGSGIAKFGKLISNIIAFVLLTFIGGSMIKEARKSEEVNADMDVKTMLMLAIATSIDALAVGVTFAVLKVKIIVAVLMIGIVTFIISSLGVKVGSVFGEKYKSKAEIAGGIILIGIGLKILIGGFLS